MTVIMILEQQCRPLLALHSFCITVFTVLVLVIGHSQQSQAIYFRTLLLIERFLMILLHVYCETPRTRAHEPGKVMFVEDMPGLFTTVLRTGSTSTIATYLARTICNTFEWLLYAVKCVCCVQEFAFCPGNVIIIIIIFNVCGIDKIILMITVWFKESNKINRLKLPRRVNSQALE